MKELTIKIKVLFVYLESWYVAQVYHESVTPAPTFSVLELPSCTTTPNWAKVYLAHILGGWCSSAYCRPSKGQQWTKWHRWPWGMIRDRAQDTQRRSRARWTRVPQLLSTQGSQGLPKVAPWGPSLRCGFYVLWGTFNIWTFAIDFMKTWK